VRVAASWHQRIATIVIDDDGPGIPAESREDVFRPFFRLESSRNIATGGVGLGLSIALDIAHSHGGEIALEDSPMGGLRVVLTLPG
jgi:two-component system osmolarity sensor histidine kinase EnvZ